MLGCVPVSRRRSPWGRYLLGLMLLGSACAGDEEFSLTTDLPCDSNNPCPEGSTCRVDRCVADGTLPEGETCTQNEQCGAALTCINNECEPGCGDLYFATDCPDGQWCRPRWDEIEESGVLPLGECTDSECDPSSTTACAAEVSCVAITGDVGACLPYCEYGFVGGDYADTCQDLDGFDFACEPLGLTSVPVCLPAGGANAPGIGAPGCDGVSNPCAAGGICVNVVCRQLCNSSQPEPCDSGLSCVNLGQRVDVQFCRAD